VSDYLRFTPDEYRSLLAAARTFPFRAPLAVFQHALVEALRPSNPTLAQRVADWREHQLCILLKHLPRERESRESTPALHGEVSGRAGGLTLQEWRSVVQACSLIWLHDDSLTSFKSKLVNEIATAEPVLANKLAQLSDEDVCVLYRRVKSGKRWCP
jgi:hypothetical protein